MGSMNIVGWTRLEADGHKARNLCKLAAQVARTSVDSYDPTHPL